MEQLDDKTYSLCEAVADIAYIAGENKYYTGDSRHDNLAFITWAVEFEEINNGVKWGIDSNIDYIDAITSFTEDKLK